MSDLAIAGILMAFLIALAIAAPIWGHDSRDRVESDQPSRRVAWLHDRNVGQAAGSARGFRGGQFAGRGSDGIERVASEQPRRRKRGERGARRRPGGRSEQASGERCGGRG